MKATSTVFTVYFQTEQIWWQRTT